MSKRPEEQPVKVLGLVQARMSSTRLPGKVLMKIGPWTALEWTVRRLKMANVVDEVVVATTTNKADRVIVEMCREKGWPVHCGSEEDVLGRTLEAATAFSPRIIVDVTSDCPFADPRHVDLLVAAILRHGADYASNIEPRSWPDGFDVQAYKMAALIKLSEDPRSNREHSGWNATQFRELRRWSYSAPKPCWHPSWRLTLDTAADLDTLRGVWERYVNRTAHNELFSAPELIKWIASHKEVMVNREVDSTTPGVRSGK